LANQESVLKSLNETAIQAGIQYPFAVHELDDDKSLEFSRSIPGFGKYKSPVLQPADSYQKKPIEVIPQTANILNHSAYY